jgi:hypothetical protein
MSRTPGAVIVIVSAILLVLAWFPLRPKLSTGMADLVSMAAGAGIGAGGLLLLTDVGTASWILAPPCVAALTALHRRALFAGAGPLRT